MIAIQEKPLRQEYELTLDAYEGTGGFLPDSHDSYLFPYPREIDFKSRKKQSYYINYIKPIVNSKVKPVFSKAPQRQYKNDIVEGFLENADNNNTPLNSIVEEAVTMSRLLGQFFVIMDNFEDVPENMNEVIAERKYPYIYTKLPQDVFSYETDLWGKLTDISFFYSLYYPDDQEEAVYLYKRYTDEEIEYWYNKKSIDGTEDVEKVVVSAFNHQLGVLPVIYYNRDILPHPPFLDMASLSRSIYNLGSEINDLSRSQAFSILLLPSINPDGDAQSNVILGSNNALFFDSQSTNIPSYISPDSNIMNTQLTRYDNLMQTLVYSADILGVNAQGGGNTAQSGLAYSYKFFAQKQELMMSSNIADYYDSKIIEMLGIFIGQDIDYDVQYTNSFAPTITETTEKLVILERISDREISDYVTAIVDAQMVELVGELFEWDDETVDNATDSIVEVSQVV